MDEECSEHGGQPLNIFCEDCDTLICIMCRVSSHKSHKFLTLSEKCKDLKKELDNFQRKQRKRTNMQSQLDHLDKVKEALNSQYRNVKKWLTEAYQKQIGQIDNIVNKKLDILQQIAELQSSYSHSSSFLMKAKDILEEEKLISEVPRYKPPGEQFMPFSEEWVNLVKNLFGHFTFDTKKNSQEKEVYFKSSLRKLLRSQSFVEIPTFTKTPQKPPSEILSQRSVSTSMINFQASSTHRSTTGTERLAPDQYINEVCLCFFGEMDLTITNDHQRFV